MWYNDNNKNMKNNVLGISVEILFFYFPFCIFIVCKILKNRVYVYKKKCLLSCSVIFLWYFIFGMGCLYVGTYGIQIYDDIHVEYNNMLLIHSQGNNVRSFVNMYMLFLCILIFTHPTINSFRFFWNFFEYFFFLYIQREEHKRRL